MSFKNIIILDITVMSCHTQSSKAVEYAKQKLEELGVKNLLRKDFTADPTKEFPLFEIKTKRGSRLFIEIWHSETEFVSKSIDDFTRARILNRARYSFKNNEEKTHAETAIFAVQMKEFEPIGYSFVREI